MAPEGFDDRVVIGRVHPVHGDDLRVDPARGEKTPQDLAGEAGVLRARRGALGLIGGDEGEKERGIPDARQMVDHRIENLGGEARSPRLEVGEDPLAEGADAARFARRVGNPLDPEIAHADVRDEKGRMMSGRLVLTHGSPDSIARGRGIRGSCPGLPRPQGDGIHGRRAQSPDRIARFPSRRTFTVTFLSSLSFFNFAVFTGPSSARNFSHAGPFSSAVF